MTVERRVRYGRALSLYTRNSSHHLLIQQNLARRCCCSCLWHDHLSTTSLKSVIIVPYSPSSLKSQLFGKSTGGSASGFQLKLCAGIMQGSSKLPQGRGFHGT